MSRPRPRRRWLVLLAHTLLVALVSCSADPSGTATATATPAAPVAVVSVDRTLVPGLREARLTAGEVSTVVPEVATLRTLTAALSMVRSQYLRQRTGALDLRWDLIASGADVLGVSLTATGPTAAGETTRVSAVWFDNRSNRAVASAGLIRAGHWRRLSEQVQTAVAARGLDPGTRPAPRPRLSTGADCARARELVDYT